MGRLPRDDRRDAILDSINDWWDSHGRGPTYRELADAIGVGSVSCVRHHLRILAEAECVTWRRCARGTLRVVQW
jgi:SOS-response transcriptional repressor LexA